MQFSSLFPSTLSRTALAVGMVVTLAGCAATQGGAVDTSGATRLQGELTSSSPVNLNDGSQYQVFNLKLKAGELVRVEQGGALEGAVLTLLDSRNQLVSGPRHGSLHLAPQADGTYRLGVSGSTASAYGPFDLTLERVTPRNSGALELNDSVFGLLSRGNDANTYPLTVAEAGLYEIALGTTISGLADSSDKVYTVTVPERSMLRIVMSSDEVDSFLKLQGPGVDTSDDDGAGRDLDAAITTLANPGSYRISASTVDGSAGIFTLSTAVQPVSSNSAQVRPGEGVSGTLAGNSVDKTLVIAEAGQYKVDMYATEFDALLRMSGNGVELEDDDGAGGTNSRISTYLEPGRYTLSARSYDNTGRGSFVISVERE